MPCAPQVPRVSSNLKEMNLGCNERADQGRRAGSEGQGQGGEGRRPRRPWNGSPGHGQEGRRPARQDAARPMEKAAGAAREVKGAVKEDVGRRAGDPRLEAEGRGQKISGRTRRTPTTEIRVRQGRARRTARPFFPLLRPSLDAAPRCRAMEEEAPPCDCPRDPAPSAVPLPWQSCPSSGACATNPATGQRQLMLVSEGQEIEMGRQADEEVEASLRPLPGREDAGLRGAPGREPGGGQRAAEPALDVPRGGRPHRQRVRAARRLHLRHARPHDPPQLRGRARLRARARDRPRHRAALGVHDQQAAARDAGARRRA